MRAAIGILVVGLALTIGISLGIEYLRAHIWRQVGAAPPEASWFNAGDAGPPLIGWDSEADDGVAWTPSEIGFVSDGKKVCTISRDGGLSGDRPQVCACYLLLADAGFWPARW